MSRSEPAYGVLLPHFGSHASRSLLLEGAILAEDLGFSSVWVRDHVVYIPHAHEDQGRVHVDPFVSLTAVASVTSRLQLGTAVLIPHRHPVQSAVMLGSLDFVAGPGRVVAGWGVGGFEHEFAAVGLGGLDRRAMVVEHVQAVRHLLEGGSSDFAGEYYEFSDVSISPVPTPDSPLPLFLGGESRAAVRRAALFGDGWLASRPPRRALVSLLERLGRVAEEAGRPTPPTAVIPYLVPDEIADAESVINVPALAKATIHHYGPPPEGSYDSVDSLDGVVITGSTDRIVDEIGSLLDLGIQQVIFDFRPIFSHFTDTMRYLGEAVLPQLPAAGSSAA